MQIRLFTLPNILTLANLLCGSFAVVFALVFGDLEASFWFIMAAVVFDFFDGFAARALGISSPLGVELDSLADVISSGLAPAAVLFSLYYHETTYSIWSWSETAFTIGAFSLFIVTAFSALRLAKFNIDETQATEFCGLPTPACSIFLTSLGLLAYTYKMEFARETIVVLALAMSILLISPVRMFSLKFHGFGWRGNVLRYIFLIVSVLLIVLCGTYSVPLIIVIYIVTSFVRWICRQGLGDCSCGGGN